MKRRTWKQSLLVHHGPSPRMVPPLSLFTLIAILKAGHGGVADVTIQMKIPSLREAKGLAQHHHGAGPRQKLRVSR